MAEANRVPDTNRAPEAGIRTGDEIPSFTIWDVTKALGPEYVDVVQDVLRMVILQLTIQFMLYLTDSERYPFFTVEFILMLLYVMLGVLVYWLVIRKLIGFK